MHLYKTLDSGIRIVEYEVALAESIAKMWNLSTKHWGGEGNVRTAQHVIDQISTATFFNLYIALDGDEVVGYCSLSRYLYDANTLIIPLLNVRPDYHNKKIGKALVLMAVERTMELGYPRLDLYTWPGNTEAVPLYKKCGFLWEDRSDTTHLVNFMPSVLKCPLFSDFFAEADWYAHSSREIEVEPDGDEINGFEVFGYDWSANGKSLAIGYERTGRSMRLIETDDYRIEMMARNHELAFGASYDVSFDVINKSGSKLNVKIEGINDQNICFAYNQKASIVGEQRFLAQFQVNAIDRPQDKNKLHPCVAADVTINGTKVRFGMGIVTKFPLWIELVQKRRVAKIGATNDCYINIKSALPFDAEVSFALPNTDIANFADRQHKVNIPANGAASVATKITTHAFGHSNGNVAYKIVGMDKEINITLPLHIVNKGLNDAFGYEDYDSHYIVNGAYSLRHIASTHGDLPWYIGKNCVVVYCMGNEDTLASFAPPKLGKPWDDEFLRADCVVRKYAKGQAMVMEIDYASDTFSGIVATKVFELSASGHVSCSTYVANKSGVAKQIMISNGLALPTGNKTYFHYDGEVSHCSNGVFSGIEGTAPEKMGENWVFEANLNGITAGTCWELGVSPKYSYGEPIFEVDCGELAAGQSFGAGKIEMFFGIFRNFKELRDYARDIYTEKRIVPTDSIEIVINGGNPMVLAGQKIETLVHNNRRKRMAGEISFAGQVQHNPPDDYIAVNKFETLIELPKKDSIAIEKISFSLTHMEQNRERALFVTNGAVEQIMDGGSHAVDNGAIRFKADSEYSEALYSLVANGKEWLKNQYPQHLPFDWWNPFIGGIHTSSEDVNTAQTVKEPRKVDFCEAKDNYGNVWKGIVATVDITDQEELKGAVTKHYYVTLPGLPVLCHFYELINGTGRYLEHTMDTTIVIGPTKEELKRVVAEFKDTTGNNHRARLGTDQHGKRFDKLIKFIDGDTEQKLYAYKDTDGSDSVNYFSGDNFTATLWLDSEAKAENGDRFVSPPLFVIVAEQDLSAEMLGDLGKLSF